MNTAKTFVALCLFWGFLAFVATVDVIRRARGKAPAIDPEHD